MCIEVHSFHTKLPGYKQLDTLYIGLVYYLILKLNVILLQFKCDLKLPINRTVTWSGLWLNQLGFCFELG